MDNLKQPKPMSMEGDLALNWKKFKQAFELYLLASGGSEKDEKIQVAVLLHCIGEEAMDVYETLEVSEADSKKLKPVLEKFESYFKPKTNPSVERHKFNIRVQSAHENFDEFLKDLKKIAASCDFGLLKDSLIKDRLVCGIRDKRIKDKLLREDDLTLEKAITICKAAELTEKHLKDMYDQGATVDAVETRQNSNKGRGWRRQAGNYTQRQPGTRWQMGGGQSNRPQHQGMNQGQQQQQQSCWFCGYERHPRANCPASNKQCAKCKKMGHFSRVCRNRTVSELEQNVENNGWVEQENCDNEINDIGFSVSTLERVNEYNRSWWITLNSKGLGQSIKFKVDTGAQVNAIPEHVFNSWKNKPRLEPFKYTVTNFDGGRVEVRGTCKIQVEYKSSMYDIVLVVVKTRNNSHAVLGLPDLIKLNMLRAVDSVELTVNQNLIEKNEDLFKGIGKIKSQPIDIKLKSDFTPRITPCRKVPFMLITPLKDELESMEKLGIIKKVTEPTEFVNPIVIVKKPNKAIRVCLDPQHLNDSILREHHQLPTFTELISDMQGSKIFSTLDANKGFWQIELTEKASKLTTFATPFGRFMFLRLPFGISVAPEIFHRVFSEIFEGLPGVRIYIDDIIIHSKTVEAHKQTLNELFQRARDYGVKFNKDKCKFFQQEVKYVGHKISEQGVQVDEDKIKVIKEMPRPKNQKELSRLLGMLTYVGMFIPNLSHQISNLRKLLKKNVIWLWTAIHDRELELVKTLLSRAPILAFFDETKEITLSVDSSKDAMGAVIFQNNRPLAYAAKALTITQQGYAQIEKEMLAITFGCQRFHQYLYGRVFKVETDHKPLVTIFNKPLDGCPLRLQRLRITLQYYDLKVEYKPGSQLHFADALSRCKVDDPSFNVRETEIQAHIDILKCGDGINPKKFQSIAEATSACPELQALKKVIQDGWPEHKDMVNSLAKQYWKIRDELYEVEGVIFKTNQAVIPQNMRKEIIDKLHYSHLGEKKTLLKAKEIVYWPQMGKEIKDKVENCPACLAYLRKIQNETMMTHEMAEGPWQIVASDLFYLKGETYLLIVDTWSKFPEIMKLTKDTTSNHVITKMKECFARQGCPEILYSDNGPQYSSQQFDNFMKQWGICHKTSTPTYAQSNGFIERHVQTIKKLMKKTLFDGKDIYMALLEYRNTPIDEKTPSPAQLLYSRKIQGQIPIKREQLKPQLTDVENLKQYRLIQKEKETNHYNKQAKDLPELKVNNKVMVDLGKDEWRPGTVVGIDESRPRAYFVKIEESGTILNRNRRFLKPYSTTGIQTRENLFDTLLEQTIKDQQLIIQKSKNNCPEINKNKEQHRIDNGIIKTERVRDIFVQPDLENSGPNTSDQVRFTRSGRVVKRPQHLKDYVT